MHPTATFTNQHVRGGPDANSAPHAVDSGCTRNVLNHLRYHPHGTHPEHEAAHRNRLPDPPTPPQRRVHHEISSEHLDAGSVDQHARGNSRHEALCETHMGWRGRARESWTR